MKHWILALSFGFVAALPSAGRADPFYLPPFLDRAPEVGDRWGYAPEVFGTPFGGGIVIEVVEKSFVGDGWHFVVADTWEFPFPVVELPPVVWTEWFFRSDGSIWRGDIWVDGELSLDLTAPLLVIRELPRVGKRRPFGHLGWPKPVERRGWIRLASVDLVGPAQSPRSSYEVRLGDRTHHTVVAVYDPALGRVAWTDRFGFDRTLVSATLGGVPYP